MRRLGRRRLLQSAFAANYKDILDSTKEPPRGGLKNWFAGYVLVIMPLVYRPAILGDLG